MAANRPVHAPTGKANQSRQQRERSSMPVHTARSEPHGRQRRQETRTTQTSAQRSKDKGHRTHHQASIQHSRSPGGTLCPCCCPGAVPAACCAASAAIELPDTPASEEPAEENRRHSSVSNSVGIILEQRAARGPRNDKWAHRLRRHQHVQHESKLDTQRGCNEYQSARWQDHLQTDHDQRKQRAIAEHRLAAKQAAADSSEANQ